MDIIKYIEIHQTNSMSSDMNFNWHPKNYHKKHLLGKIPGRCHIKNGRNSRL